MEVKCDKCGGTTKPKQITSKKDGKIYTVYECDGTCMNGRFKYSCFAPKEPKVSQSSTALDEINHTLRRIEAILLGYIKDQPPEIRGEVTQIGTSEADEAPF